MSTRVPATVATLVVWVAAIWGAYRWSLDGGGWEIVNAVIVAVFGLAAVVPLLIRLWRRP
jgi:hypothetical protein